MSHDNINFIWNSQTKIQKPKILILKYLNRDYAVVNDSSSIITVISKSNVVYAVAKTRTEILEDEDDNFNYYNVENPRSLKVISCTEDSTKKYYLDQGFVMDNITKYLK